MLEPDTALPSAVQKHYYRSPKPYSWRQKRKSQEGASLRSDFKAPLFEQGTIEGFINLLAKHRQRQHLTPANDKKKCLCGICLVQLLNDRERPSG